MKRPPDATNPPDPFWLDQLDIVASWADLRMDRADEIVTQMAPPVVYGSSVLNLHPGRRRWTLELVAAALRLANLAHMRFKHELACRRPVELSPQIQPMIQTPGHGSLPSGHATEAFIVARVLWSLVSAADGSKDKPWLEQLMRQAARVAINRTVAGVHFAVDSAAGQLLGLALGSYLVSRATTGVAGKGWFFDGTQFGNIDFDWRKQFDTNTAAQQPAGAWATQIAATMNGLAPATLLAEVWRLAQAEWP
jgi:hypothetical protein